MLRLFVLLILLCSVRAPAGAQDLSGTWEGTEEGNYMKLVIVKVGEEYVGYTYDTDPAGGWCRANFRAVFRAGASRLRGQGEGMIAHKGGHVECSYDLEFIPGRSGDRLSGSERTKGATKPLFSFLDFDDGPVELRRVSRRVDTTEYMRRFLPPPPPPAVTKAPKPTPPAAVRTNVPPRRATPKPTTPARRPPAVVKTQPKPATPARKDSLVTVRQPLPKATPPAPMPHPVANNPLLALKRGRSNNIVQEISTTEKVITIRVFDNGMPDGDTVSILHNNEVLFDHKLVAVQSFSFTVKLDEGDAVHDITLIANNVGSIPPNTASIVVEAGDERYRLTASTDLQRNAVIRIVYKP
ncbi:MAG: hypothetical protein EOO08_03670 [Chitinophagaceae bacterium]|nr:MAG: hypothetical protein EOO08_03670 [Chitinophagaceae bacterium]